MPALGDAILGVDVSADGRWLVATCKTYLLLIDTLIGEGRYKGQLGFDRSFPAEAKPVPRRLQLKPEHVSYMQGKVEFTPARFNTGLGEEEKSIVTSSGEFVITCALFLLKCPTRNIALTLDSPADRELPPGQAGPRRRLQHPALRAEGCRRQLPARRR